jgi:WD40 repeat protein
VSRIFLSHSSHNNPSACALRDWLIEHGWEDVFLDLDPRRGLAAGQRWQDELKKAADRCEAVLFVLTPAWAVSRFCQVEFSLARMLGKHVFGVIAEPVALEELPVEMTSEFQIADLTAVGDAELRTTSVMLGDAPVEVRFSKSGLERLRIGLEKAGLDARSFKLDLSRPRYPGLRALDTQDAAIFFGRDADIVRGMDLIRHMRESGKRILVVLGASGSGKSSFVRAGLWPRLQRADRDFFLLPVLRPENAALEGPQGLVACLGKGNRAAVRASLAKPGGLTAVLRESVACGESSWLPVLVIDQAEELFHSDAGAEATTLLERVGEAVRSGELLIIAAIRSEAYERLQAARPLQGIEQVLYSLPPIAEGTVKELIEGPARREAEALGANALRIDPALTERLMRDWAGSDALPLLAFTLERLVNDYGADGRIDLAEYESSRGLAGAIEAAVESALRETARDPAERERLVRAAFIPWLVRIDAQSRAAQRKVATFDQLPAATRPLIEQLVEARLLNSDSASIEGPETRIIEVAHEALLRQWPLLARLIEDERAALSALEDVRRDAAAWSAADRADDSLLHRGSRLANVEFLLARDDFQPALGEDGRAYLSACRKRGTDERERERRQIVTTRMAQRRATVLLSVLAVLIAAAAVGVIKVRRDAGRTRSDALAALASIAYDAHQYDRAVRFALAGMVGHNTPLFGFNAHRAEVQLARAAQRSLLRLRFDGQSDAAFSHDGKRVVTIADRVVHIWDAATGRELATLKGHTKWIRAVAFSRHDERVVTASEDGEARVWDAVSGQPSVRLVGHRDSVSEAAFSDDGTRVVTSGFEGDHNTVRVWNASNGRQIAMLSAPFSQTLHAVFNQDGTRVLISPAPPGGSIWDPVTGRMMKLEGSEEGIDAAFSDDGKLATAPLGLTALIWDVTTGREMKRLPHRHSVTSAAFDHEGKRVVTASDDGLVHIWDVATGRELTAFWEKTTSAVFSSDGSRLVTVSADDTARIWDAVTGSELAHLEGHQRPVQESRDPLPTGIKSAAFNRDGSRVVTAGWDESVRLWDAKGNELVRLSAWSSDDVLRAAFFDREGKRVMTESSRLGARLWDASSGREIRRPEPQVAAMTTVVPRDVDGQSWRNAIERKRATLEGYMASIGQVAPSKDGSRVVVAATLDDPPVAYIRDATTGRALVPLKLQTPINSAAFNHAGTRLVTTTNYGIAQIWDAATGQPLKKLKTDGSWGANGFSDDDTLVATAADDDTVRIWEVATGRLLIKLAGHDSSVNSVEFNHEGTLVVTAAGDSTARIWDVATGQEIARLGQDKAVNTAFFDHDGSRVVTTSSTNGTARIWDTRLAAALHGDELVHATCREVLSVDTAAAPLPNDLSRFSAEELQLAPVLDPATDDDACRPATSWDRLKATFRHDRR